MEVQVWNTLSSIGARVENKAIPALREPLSLGDITGCREQRTKQIDIVSKLREVPDVLIRND